MPNETDNHKSVRIKSWLAFGAVLLFALPIAYGFVRYQDNRNQQALRQDLDNSSEALDVMAREIKTAIPEVEPVRLNNCYRDSGNLNEGPIYCSQTIKFERSEIMNDVIESDLSKLSSIVSGITQLQFVDVISNEEDTVIRYLEDTIDINRGCEVRISKKLPKTNQGFTGYDFKAECLSGDFESFIYPQV